MKFREFAAVLVACCFSGLTLQGQIVYLSDGPLVEAPGLGIQPLRDARVHLDKAEACIFDEDAFNKARATELGSMRTAIDKGKFIFLVGAKLVPGALGRQLDLPQRGVTIRRLHGERVLVAEGIRRLVDSGSQSGTPRYARFSLIREYRDAITAADMSEIVRYIRTSIRPVLHARVQTPWQSVGEKCAVDLHGPHGRVTHCVRGHYRTAGDRGANPTVNQSKDHWIVELENHVQPDNPWNTSMVAAAAFVRSVASLWCHGPTGESPPGGRAVVLLDCPPGPTARWAWGTGTTTIRDATDSPARTSKSSVSFRVGSAEAADEYVWTPGFRLDAEAYQPIVLEFRNDLEWVGIGGRKAASGSNFGIEMAIQR
ncbi:MAG: hypothetical protein KIT09_11830 [Bryobacteraceae bacterium]|nr:hypothetical protein [Bryobacteraceae bacterium]